MDDRRWHRAPAVLRKISEIDPEHDIRVRLVGTVKRKNDGSFVIADGKDVEIVAESDILGKLNEGDLVRAFCRVMALESGFELKAEFVQNTADLEQELYKRVYGYAQTSK